MEDVLIMIIATIVVVSTTMLFSKSDKRKKRDALNNPNNLEDNLEIGVKLYNEKKLDEALIFFNNINRNIKKDETAIADYFRGFIFFEKQDYSQAKDAFESFSQNERFLLDKKDFKDSISTVHFLLGGIYFLEGRLDDAKLHKDRAISFDSAYQNTDHPRFPGYIDL